MHVEHRTLLHSTAARRPLGACSDSPPEDVALMRYEGFRNSISNAGGHSSDHNHPVDIHNDSQAGSGVLVVFGALPPSKQPALLLLCSCNGRHIK